MRPGLLGIITAAVSSPRRLTYDVKALTELTNGATPLRKGKGGFNLLDMDPTDALQFKSLLEGGGPIDLFIDPLDLWEGAATSDRSSSSVNDSELLLLDSNPRLVGASWVSVK